MPRFYCTKCSFKLEKKEIPQRRPYCGKTGTIEQEKTAQDLLDEVSQNQEHLD